jgi:hypothetical protein
MKSLGAGLVVVVVFAFVGWQVWRVLHATHEAFSQRPYTAKRFPKVLSGFEKRAGKDATLLDLRLATNGARFLAVDTDGRKEYSVDENGHVKKVQTLRGPVDVTRVFPLSRVDSAAPQRIFDAIAADTGHKGYLFTAKLELDSKDRLRWTADAGKLGFGSGDYEALPDGTISKRPEKANVSASYLACIKNAGTSQAKATACRKLLPGHSGPTAAQIRSQKYSRCLGKQPPNARTRRCQRLYHPEVLAFAACSQQAKTAAAARRCDAALERASKKNP